MLRISNAILDFPMSPSAFKVYVYLLSCAGADHIAIVRASRVAQRCHICANTVRSAVTELAALGLVQKQNRYNAQHHYIANAYTVTTLAGRWFALDTTNNPFAIGNSTFVVYLYLLRCRGRNGKAFPSLRRIERAVGVCRAVVVKAIKQLAALGLIVKAALRAGKHNLYTVLRTLLFKIDTKKEVQRAGCTSPFHTKRRFWEPFCKAIISPFCAAVKRKWNGTLSFMKGVVYFLSNNAFTHPTTIQERE